MNKKMFLSIVCFVTSLLAMSNGFACNKKLDSGFCWPLNAAHNKIATPFLEPGSDHGGSYFNGEYHIGTDISAPLNAVVWPVADGEVIHASYNGWSAGATNNYALLVKHTTSTGEPFIALYGHMIIPSKKWKKGDEVYVNKPIGVIGDWNAGDHLHLSIWSNKSSIPGGKYGRGKWSEYPETYGQVDPINFLNTHYPKLGPLPHHKVSIEDTRWWSQTKDQTLSIAWYPANVPCHKATSWHKNETCSADYGNKDACQKFYSILVSIDPIKYQWSSDWKTVFFGDTDDYRNLCGY
jgi:murein DD-endopeptidase MepM/ murein hydrolase activator NlpD